MASIMSLLKEIRSSDSFRNQSTQSQKASWALSDHIFDCFLQEGSTSHLGQLTKVNTVDGVSFNAKDVGFFGVHVATAKAGGVIATAYRPKVTERLLRYASQLFEAGININTRGQKKGAGRSTARSGRLIRIRFCCCRVSMVRASPSYVGFCGSSSIRIRYPFAELQKMPRNWEWGLRTAGASAWTTLSTYQVGSATVYVKLLPAEASLLAKSNLRIPRKLDTLSTGSRSLFPMCETHVLHTSWAFEWVAGDTPFFIF